MLQVLDLFSGYGGFSIGLERTGGFETAAFCEIEPFQRRVLAKHWPNVKCYHDVRDLSAQHLTADGIFVDVICGGFPCQDISIAGKGEGLAGARSGLWREFARLIGELRPAYVIVENVSALLARGLGDVLGDLASLGYDAEWHCIPASAVGAPHQRDRIWIVAHASCAEWWWEQQKRRQNRRNADSGGYGPQGHPVGDADAARREGLEMVERRERRPDPQAERAGGALADADGGGWGEQGHVGKAACDTRSGQPRDSRANVADADGGVRQRVERYGNAGWQPRPANGGVSNDFCLAGSARLSIGPGTLGEWAYAATTGTGWWAAEPDVGRVVDGPADKVDRRKRLIALGNGVVPDIPEILGRAILEREAAIAAALSLA